MTSYFARYGTLSPQTHALAEHGARPQNVYERLNFYMNYLQDVVPHRITVQHIPSDRRENKSQEIHLLTPSGKIFMSGLVNRARNHHHTEDVAGSEAYTYWLEGEFAPDGDNWRFFTGLAELRFFNSDQGDSWDLQQSYHAMDYADYVAEYLQEKYDSFRYS